VGPWAPVIPVILGPSVAGGDSGDGSAKQPSSRSPLRRRASCGRRRLRSTSWRSTRRRAWSTEPTGSGARWSWSPSARACGMASCQGTALRIASGTAKRIRAVKVSLVQDRLVVTNGDRRGRAPPTGLQACRHPGV